MPNPNQHTQRLVIIGAGGLGQEIAYAVRCSNIKLLRYGPCGFCDDDPSKHGREIGGLPVLGLLEDCGREFTDPVLFVCAVGDNRKREALVSRAERMGWRPTSIIDPSAIVSPEVEAGEGSYIAALSVLSADARIGRHVIVNYGSSIGHNTRVGDYCQICPGARVSGYCTIGRGGFVGSNAVMGPGAELGDYAVLGAASFVAKGIPAGATAVGNPARVVFRAG